MTRNSRNILMATTLLAGLAIFGIDTAQAGPNNIGGAGGGGFSSMRMDFGRIGNPTTNRLLSPEDRRIVPLDVKKSVKKDDKKNAGKKGTNITSAGRIRHSAAGVSSVPNQTPSTGGQDKPGVQRASELPIPGALVDIFTLFGGNRDAILGLKDVLAWIENGPNVLADPIFGNGGGPGFQKPTLGATGRFGWGSAGDGPGNRTPRRFKDPTGLVGGWVLLSTREGNGYREGTYYDAETGRTGTVRSSLGE